MIVVSDSSPLITLAAIGRLELLRTLFSSVLIPDAVYREIIIQGAGRPGTLELRAVDWISQRTVTDKLLASVLQQELGAGEAEAIVLALESDADLVILDERRGRERASELGLKITGVLGILVEAKRQGLTSSAWSTA